MTREDPSAVTREDAGAEPAELVAELIDGRRYAAVRTLTPFLTGLDTAARRDVRGLCRFAERVLELDAEDFASLEGVPSELALLVSVAHIPATPRQADRGALGSLRPTYRLFLEVLAVRWDRGELNNVLAVLHLMGEYLPLLAWEPVLGHAGDPNRLPAAVTGPGSRWGTADGRCDHPPGLRRSLRTALSIADQDEDRWQRYLDRDHSRVSAALGQCAAHPERGRPDPGRLCTDPCSVWTRIESAPAADLQRRMTLVGLFVESPVLALRHAAPVGHGFGVPDRRELTADWTRTWEQLRRPWPGGGNPLTGVCPAGGPLPGLAELVSAVAATTIAPLGVFDRVDALLAARLDMPTPEPARVDSVVR